MVFRWMASEAISWGERGGKLHGSCCPGPTGKRECGEDRFQGSADGGTLIYALIRGTLNADFPKDNCEVPHVCHALRHHLT